ncbi:MAG: glutamine amidotransferase [Hyphomicrobiaceae bacterium]|nr:glutamine amidotransferase [Hyphomicrobiaceae bacterium]
MGGHAPLRSAMAVQHVAFEGLGVLGSVLNERGYSIDVIDAASVQAATDQLTAVDLLVVLGGPIGVYQQEEYPFLSSEIDMLKLRLSGSRPTLGICLGAQLMAAALGARVFAGPGKEIGWGSISLTPEGRASPLFALAADVPVLHWHGDTFDLPVGAERLASTALTRNQAFAIGPHALGLQFHVECDGSDIEHWLIGHACELGAAGVDIGSLREDSKIHGPGAALAGRQLFRSWLDGFAA